MAERRMMAKSITESDFFYDLPLTAQALYLHLCQNADDDGFVSSPKTVQRMTGAKEKDMKALIDKKFVLAFPSGVIVIKHWRIHNLIAKDRYKPTNYKEEKASLFLDENKAYSLSHGTCILDVLQNDDISMTQVRLGKDRLNNNTRARARKPKTMHDNNRNYTSEEYEEMEKDALRRG